MCKNVHPPCQIARSANGTDLEFQYFSDDLVSKCVLLNFAQGKKIYMQRFYTDLKQKLPRLGWIVRNGLAINIIEFAYAKKFPRFIYIPFSNRMSNVINSRYFGKNHKYFKYYQIITKCPSRDAINFISPALHILQYEQN